MKNMKKIAIITLVLSFLIQSLPNTKSMAAVIDSGISTQSENLSGMSILLDIDSDGITRCYANITGEPGTTRIEGTMKLKKVTSSGTTTEKSWNISANSHKLLVSKTCYILSKGTYRLEVKVKVTRNGKSETTTGSTTQKF